MKQRADFIIPECYVDTNLIETLIGMGCNHQKGCNQVANIMKGKFSERFAIGIIDGDKRRPGYLDEFDEIGETEHLKAYRHRERVHYILMINPAIEKLIIDSAKVAEVSLSDFELAGKLEELKKQTKQLTSNRDPRFKNLFQVLKKDGEIKLLKNILGYLSHNQYNSSPEALKNLLIAN